MSEFCLVHRMRILKAINAGTSKNMQYRNSQLAVQLKGSVHNWNIFKVKKKAISCGTELGTRQSWPGRSYFLYSRRHWGLFSSTALFWVQALSSSSCPQHLFICGKCNSASGRNCFCFTVLFPMNLNFIKGSRGSDSCLLQILWTKKYRAMVVAKRKTFLGCMEYYNTMMATWC